MSKYKNMSQNKYDCILMDILKQTTAAELISVPGIYEIVSEEFNNQVLDIWEAEYSICPVCNEPTNIDDNGDLLLCDDCAQAKSDAADRADHINRCDW